MKKTTILCVWALLCLNICANAQNKPKLPSLKIGDKLPALFWDEDYVLYDSADPVIKPLKNYKDKNILLDFWASWCGACLKEFPKMNALQNKYRKHLKVLMINTSAQDTPKLLKEFIKRQEYSYALTIVAYNKKMQEIFLISSMPHYIWIGSDGRIKAITNAEAVTETQLKRLIAGLPINLKVKEN